VQPSEAQKRSEAARLAHERVKEGGAFDTQM
jgi:hypothetical protein